MFVELLREIICGVQLLKLNFISFHRIEEQKSAAAREKSFFLFAPVLKFNNVLK